MFLPKNLSRKGGADFFERIFSAPFLFLVGRIFSPLPGRLDNQKAETIYFLPKLDLVTSIISNGKETPMKFILAIFLLSVSLLLQPNANAASGPEDEVLIEVVPSEVKARDVYYHSEKVEISLEGIFPNSCYQPSAAQVTRSEGKILVTDTATFYGDRLCTTALVPYRKSVEVGTLPAGTYDLYINDGGRFRPATKITVQ